MFSAVSRLWTSQPELSIADNANDVSSQFKICEIETQTDRKTRDLRHLIKLNHSEFSLFDSSSERTNGIPDVLVAAYSVGLSSAAFDSIFEAEMLHTPKWSSPPSEVSKLDWMESLGQPSYQRAYLDYFEDELVEYGYDWRRVMIDYLFRDQCALFRFSFHTDGSPLIRLASAFEVSSRELAMEAAAMYSICPAPYNAGKPSPLALHDRPNGLRSMIEILSSASKIEANRPNPGLNIELEIYEFWSQLNWREPVQLLDEMQQIAALLILSQHQGMDTFNWLLWTSHALRVMLPLIPPQMFEIAQRQWWWHCIEEYMKSDRPKLSTQAVFLACSLEEARDAVDKKIQALEAILDRRTLLDLHGILSASKSSENPKFFLYIALRLLNSSDLY